MRAIAALLVVCALTIGCGSKTEPQAKPPEHKSAQTAAKPPAQPKGYLETVLSKQKDAEAVAWILAVRQSIVAYQAINGAYPKTLDDLNKDGLTVPPVPKHRAAKYDPKTGKVDLVTVK